MQQIETITMHKDQTVYVFVAQVPEKDPMLPTCGNNLIVFETIDRAKQAALGYPGQVVSNSLEYFCDVAGIEGWGVFIQAADGDMRKVLGYNATALFNPGGIKDETRPPE